MEPITQKQINHINYFVAISFFIISALVYLIQGSALAKGTLLGCAIVGVNYYLSQNVIRNLLNKYNSKLPFVFIYILKFITTIGALYYSVTVYKMNVWGIMIGLSSVLLIPIFSIITKPPLK